MTEVVLDGRMSMLEAHRSELGAYCYRMLGSAFDADDAVQETLVKAWQGLDRFEGRAALRSWLYRIATNVCLDALRGRSRRALPVDLSGPTSAQQAPNEPLPEDTWVTPYPDTELDPSDRVVARESVRLAFVAALQHLPSRQRAVLILRDVLCWQAAEVAELLETSVVSVNSLLQRARATLSERDVHANVPLQRQEDRELVARYVAAFEAYDIDSLVTLLHEDARQSMPPIPMWLQGRDEIAAWLLGHGIGCQGSRLLPTSANGMPAFGQYRRSTTGSGHDPWALQVLDIEDGRIVHFHAFLDTRLFARFGLPEHLGV